MEEQILQLNPQPGASSPEAQAGTQIPDASPDDRAREHYANVIGKLYVDATKNKTQSVLVNVIALNLAWLVVEYGSYATG